MDLSFENCMFKAQIIIPFYASFFILVIITFQEVQTLYAQTQGQNHRRCL